jgi:hypothetical protein
VHGEHHDRAEQDEQDVGRRLEGFHGSPPVLCLVWPWCRDSLPKSPGGEAKPG